MSEQPRAIPYEQEQEALDCLARYMEIVWHGWGLRANESEQAAAVHVLQGAVIQHMLNRIEPARWGSWWDDRESKTTIYARQAAEAAKIVDSWPDSIKRNVIPPPSSARVEDQP